MSAATLTLRSGPRLTLAPPQRPLLASQRRNPLSPLQNMGLVTTFDGDVDVDRLVAAFATVVAASDVLRTTITGSDEVELLPAGAAPRTAVIDVADQVEARAWAEERARTPIDLSQGVYDSAVLRGADGTTSWYLAIHHVATDATSSTLVTEATARAYAGEPVELPTYYDRWDGDAPDRRRERAERHWYTRRAPARVGRLYSQNTGESTKSRRRPLDLAAIRSAAEEALDGPYRMLSPDLSWTTLLITVVGAYLGRVTGATEFAIGMPVHNRTDVASRDVVGPLMEVFPVDVAVDPDATFAELHAATARSVMTTLRNARPGTPGASAEVEGVVNVIPRAEIDAFGDIPTVTDWVHTGHTDPSHLFRLQLTPYGDDGQLVLDLNDGAADETQAHRAVGHVTALLHAAVTTPDAVIGSVELIDTDEQTEIDAWGEGAPITRGELVVPRIATALAGRADLAIEDGDVRLTGAELDRRIGHVAAWLRAQGIGTGPTPERVAIDLPRSADAVVAIHAVLRAGGSFVPLDPSQPEQRRTRLVERAGCVLTIADLPTDDELPVDPLEPHLADRADEAYLLFTSGSTGEPKGVPITHGGLADYVEFAQDAYVAPDLTPVAPLFSALTFDLTITTVFVPLVRHGRLVVVRESGGAGLAAIAERNDLTWMKATPSHLEILLRLGFESPLRSLVVGGEAFLGRVARRLFRTLPEVRIFNEYGPTEAVVGCMIHEATTESLGDAAEVPIGVPAPGVTLRIVDSQLRDVPRGASGELLISHDGVTAGYLDVEHDEGKFVEVDGRRFYRSGDLVRLEDAHTAVYQGRIDEQIKLGGIRLEPVEVEHALIDHPSVTRATVRVWEPERKPAAQHCVRCGLPSNVPGAVFDADGVCNSCHDYDRVKVQAEDYFRTPDDLQAIQRAARAMRSGKYDALHLLSGGKDSTYALYQLHEMGFEVYSMTLDNGYISEGAKENVRQSVAELGIDHEFVTLDAMDDIFRDSLERFSNVCHGCYKAIYTVATTRADQLGIPVIVTGLSRGQLFETRLIPQQFSSERFDADAIDRAVIEARRAYHRIDDAPRRLLDTEVFDRPDDDVFSRISYVDFYRYVDVPLSEMYHYLDNNAPWVRPDDTGRSTNCLVNAAGIHSHLTEQGYHNYAMPYAWDVRLGHKTRTEAMEELDDELDMTEIGEMLGKIGFDPKPQQTLTAWIEPADGASMPTPAELRTFLADRVPSYALPAAFVEVDEIPMTTNGKVDTAMLPAPTRTHRTGATVRIEPESELEREIVAVYELVLGATGVGVTDDFFELGGDSLAAIGLAVRLSERLAVTVREEQVFANTTARDLAAALEIDGTSGDAPTPRAEGETPFVNEAEQGLLFEYLNDPEDPRYNVGVLFTLGAGVDIPRMIDALRTVVAAHVPLSWTYAEPRVQLPIDDALEVVVRGAPTDEAAFRTAARRVHLRPFDLHHGPMGRCMVQPLDDGGVALFVSFHHISIDAYSFDKLWSQVETVYVGGELPDMAIDYADWSRWQLDNLADDATEPWLDGFEPGAPIRLGDGGGDSGYVSIDASFDLQGLRTGPGVTPVATALGGLTSVLAARADGDRLTIDLLLSSREHASADDLIGYFLNPLPIELCAPASATGDELAEVAGESIRTALTRRTVPRSRIVTDRRARGLATLPDDVLFIFEDWHAGSLGAIEARHEVLATGSPVTGASFFVLVDDGAVTLGLEHDGRVLTADEATALLVELDQAISAMIDRPGTAPIDRPDPVPVDPTDVIVDGPPLELPAHPTLTGLLDAAAGAADDRPAVRHGGVEVDYRTLLGRAHATAAALADAGVAPGDRVAVMVDRSVDQIVGVLGALYAGAAYVPVDPSYPAERRRLVLDDAAPAAVITTDADAPGHVVVEPATEPDPAATWTPPTIDPESIAYVIYTSGSTGRPKGVAVRHRNIVASTLARREFSNDPVRAFLLLSSFAFDSSMVGIWGSLTGGGTLVLPTADEADDIVALGDVIRRHDVSHLLALPSLYRVMLTEIADDLQRLTSVVVAGEACPVDVIELHHERLAGVALVNEYGPTEATVWTHGTVLTPQADGVVPIGRPIAGARHVVLDAEQRPTASGRAGELYVGGLGITAGYLDRPELTAERFTTLDVDPSGATWYRTGDLVQVLADGQLAFVGRADHQVKVRGFRIEPGEVETAITALPGVEDAVVDARSVGGRTQLVGWFTGDAADATIRDALAAELPSHMVPSLLVGVPRFPTGPTGKIDRDALQVPDTGTPRPSRLGSTEALVADVWRDVLGIDDIGATDDFFALGGDSILSMQVCARLRAAGHEIRPKDLFDHPTVARLAEFVGGAPAAAETIARPVDIAPVVGVVPMTPVQRWFLAEGFEQPTHWHQTSTLDLAPDIDADRLLSALDVVRGNHPALRARFVEVGTGWQQVVAPEPAPLVRARPDAGAFDSAVAEIVEAIDHTIGTTVGVVVGADRVFVAIHHLVVDGVSWSTLVDDWADAYDALSAGAKPEQLRSAPAGSSIRDWGVAVETRAFSDDLHVDWPLGERAVRRRPQVEHLAVEATLAPADTTALQARCGDWGTGFTLEHALVAAVSAELGPRLGETDLEIALEGHGREAVVGEHLDPSSTIGWFTSLFPVVVPCDGADPVDHHRAVHQAIRRIPDRGTDYLIGRSITGLPLAPLGRVGVNFLGDLDRAVRLQGPFRGTLALRGSVGERNHALHEVGVMAAIRAGQLELRLEHDPDVLDAATATAIVDGVLERLRSFTGLPVSLSGRFDLVPFDEPGLRSLAGELQKLAETS